MISMGQLMAAVKTDTITLYNGDKITCEVKQLTKGMLQVKTSDIGTSGYF